MNRIQVNLRGLPSHVLEAVCRPDTAQNTRSPESIISPLTFPKSKMHLWDPTPNGDPVSLHLSYYRKPRLLLMEKALRLAHRHARQSKKPQFSCFLLGTLAVESDEEGVTITLDRFDPGREQPDGSAKSPTALLPGDVLVPCLFDAQRVPDSTVYSAHDLDITFRMLEHSCSSREAMELCKLMSLRVRLSCVENMDRLSFSLHWAGVTLASSLEAVPVRVLPIIPTALARTLSSPASMAQPLHTHASARRRGFLTMDQTRKLLLILESDPKVYTLPLVGVWLSGVTHIHNPVVWAWCLRYLYSSSLHDRVMSEDDAFLVVLYSLTHRDPEFYQCKLRGPKDMSFQPLICTESLTLYKNVEPAEGRSLHFELGAESQNQEAELFKEALSRSALARAGTASSAVVQNKLSISDHDSGVEDEDLSPRPSPNPHPISQQTRQVQPSVPELSMVLDGSFLDGKAVESHEHTLTHPVQSNPQLKSCSSGTPASCPAPRPTAQTVMAGPPPIRRPLTPILSQPKLNRTQSTIGHQPSMCRKSIPSVSRRSSNAFSASSSSSSSSSPKTGSSPNSSVHERTQRSGHPNPPAPNQKSKKVSINPDQTPLLPPSQHMVFHSTPAFNPTCGCCPAHRAHMPMYQGNTWQGTLSPPLHCPPEGSPHRDCCVSPTRPALSLGCRMSPAQSPVCHAGVPLHYSPSHGPRVPNANPCAGALDQTAPMCQAQCCQLQPGPAAVTAPDIGMGLLPADAYRMLMEQDRQLKQLQAQIEKLLEAQSKVPEPPRASPEGPQEQAIQTVALSEPLKKTSVSIAVGTGASLFWSAPDQSSTHEGQSIDGHPEANSTVSPRLSSEKIHHGREDQSPVTPRHATSSPQHNTSDVAVSFPSPVLGESASMYYNSQSRDAEDSQNGEVPTQRFYQELLGQVKSRLQDCVNEEEKTEHDVHSPRPRPSPSPRNSPPNKPALREQNAEGSEEDRVFSATLKQLQSLGVDVELNPGKSNRSTVESASTLAFINPDAVIPRLTLSESVGTSIWGLSGGVDLSLEANAIALKYLSDSQLSRLSLGGQSPGARANSGALLFGRTALDKSSTGLSILSSSNMSLATCKYMKKYGLMEGGGGSSSSGEEEDDCGETAQNAHTDSALGCSLQLDTSENVRRERETGFIRKNVSNKQPEPLLSTQDSQSQLIRDLRPKLQLLAHTKTSPEKENNPKHVLPQPRPQRRSSLSDSQRLPSLPETQGSVGNFLDLSRLRQLPKLF